MLDATVTHPKTLDAMQIAALRQADVISFHHYEGRAFIRATKRHKASKANPFAGEAMLEIECEHRLTDYTPWTDREAGRLDESRFKAFEMVHTPRLCEEWQTVLRHIKAGDVIRLYWEAGALTTEGLRKAGFVGDKMSVILERGKLPNGGCRTSESYWIGHQVSPADGITRMISGPRK